MIEKGSQMKSKFKRLIKDPDFRFFWKKFFTYYGIFLVEYILWLNGFFEWLKGLLK